MDKHAGMCPHETNTHTRVFQRQCLVSQLICLKTIQMISVMEAQIRGTPPFASHTTLDCASPSFLGGVSCFFFPLERRVERWGRGGQCDRPLRTPRSTVWGPQPRTVGGRSPGRSTDRAEAQTAADGGSSMGQGRESQQWGSADSVCLRNTW